MSGIPNKFFLPEERLPRQWYNVQADMTTPPPPPLHPGTHEPLSAKEFSAIFSEDCSAQEFNTADPFIDIPEEVQAFYKTFRPAPLHRAYALEKALQTPAHIYYKFEGNNTSGSHKLNSAAAQVYYAKKQGLTGLATETGAGQWGTALSMACAYFNLPLTVFMVRVSFDQKPYRKAVMQTYGARVLSSPSDLTEVGRALNEKFPGTNGSLGCAISEAVEYAMQNEGHKYVLGSVLNHVLLHQSVIGLETKLAMEMLDVYPDIIIGCAGGGSSLGGLSAAFIRDKLTGKGNPYIIAVEPASCPSLTRGKYVYDFCDTGHVTPLAKMYTLGSEFMPASNHAGGLRYHGMAPILSQLYDDGVLDEARAVEQTKVFEAGLMFARTEMILPAPESCHAVRVAIDEALTCKESGEKKTLLFCLTGTGYFDMTAYNSYFDGTMTDHVPTDAELQTGFDAMPVV